MGCRALFSERRTMASNYTCERAGLASVRAHVRQVQPFASSARLKRLRPTAQRER